MKYFIFIFLFLQSFTHADCRGCCSRYGGNICKDGKTICKDGTALSAKCLKKGCNKCEGSAAKSKTIKQTESTKVTNLDINKNCDQEYNSARVKLRDKLGSIFKNTFYCGCSWSSSNKKIELANCGIEKRKIASSLQYIQLEHIVPKSWIKKASRYSDGACSDIFNLMPTIGKANNKRRNYLFGEIVGEDYFLGKCDFEVKDQLAEPKKEIRGDIARIHFYMIKKYGIGVEAEYLSLLKKWNKADPVSNEECDKHKALSSFQKDKNLFVELECD